MRSLEVRIPAVLVGCSLLAAGCGGGATEAAVAEFERGPTPLVLILIDTLRWDRLGCYGYPRPTTPELDAFAAEALRFERCLAQSTWTRPSTASLHTGLYPSRHGATSPFRPLDESFETLAETLRDAGYATAAFGSNPHIFADTGFDQGFDTFVSPEPTDERLAYTRGDVLVDQALAWLAARDEDAPYFLYLHLFDPHAPYDPPEPFRTRFDRGSRGERNAWYMLSEGATPAGMTGEDRAHYLDLYDAEVAFADAQVGRLLDALNLDETAVVVVSDHGEELFDHGGWSHEPTMYDELLRVPLLVSFPALRARGMRGGVVTDLAQQVDLVPTMLDQLGLPERPQLPGKSLFAKALGAAPPTDHGIAEVDEPGDYKKAVVAGGMKYIRAWAPEAREQLFDLDLDPYEQEDLAGRSPTQAGALRRILDLHIDGAPGRYCIEFENRSEAMTTVTGYIVTEVERVSGSSLTGCEFKNQGAEDWDGPFLLVDEEVDGEPRPAVRFTLRTRPGDTDGLVFSPSGREERVRIFCVVDGAPLDPRRAFLGAEGEQPTGSPIEIDLTTPRRYTRTEAPGAARSGGPYALSVWRTMDAQADEQELSDEERSKLSALGYGGR